MKDDTRGAIVFDFDGTIADSFAVALDIFNSFSRVPFVKTQDINRLRGMALLQIARELKVPRYKIPFLLIRGRRAMHKRMGEVGIVPGMDRVIKQLSKSHKLFVLSSNSTENIEFFLTRYKLKKYFSDIQGNAGLLGKSKKIQKLVVANRLDRSRTWYVGDESRDVDAAHRSRLKVVAVTWGYNNKKALARRRPELLVSKTDELLSCFSNYSK